MEKDRAERLRRSLEVMRAMCEDGSLLTSECERAPVTKPNREDHRPERREKPREAVNTKRFR